MGGPTGDVAAVGSGPGRVRFRPPRRQTGHLPRPRVVQLIDERLRDESTLLVVAPSGYGKTSAVSEWAAAHPDRVVWLTLGPFDSDPGRVGVQVLQALQSLARSGAPDLAGLLSVDLRDMEPVVAFDLISEQLAEATEPVYLVLDDAHRAQLREGLLGALIELGCEPLKLVVLGTSFVEIALSRLAVTRPHVPIRASDLAFTLDEVAGFAEKNASLLAPESTLAVTGGWPLAVRFVHMTGVNPDPGNAPDPSDTPDETLLQEYLRDHLLVSVPAEVADFALITSICGEMSAGLAAAVSERSDAGELLEQCVRLGLFIDRFDTPLGISYRWHGLFARQCRAVLARDSPERFARACAAAAGFTEQDQPLRSADFWLRAGETQKAIDTVLTHWTSLIVGHDVAALDSWCAGLPRPHHEDPSILLIRACAQDVSGARELALILKASAESRAALLPDTGQFEKVRAQAALLLTDDRAGLAAASEKQLREHLASSDSMSPHVRAATTYLLGHAELRHRRSPKLAAQLLSSAAVEAEAAGDPALAGRARSNLAFVLAWAGRLTRARATLAQLADASDDESWTAYAGGAAAAAAGFIAYWTDDLDAAVIELRRSVRGGSSPIAFAGIARMMLAFTASAARDPQICQLAAREVQAIPTEECQGVSWPAFRHAALASLHEAAGSRDRAMKIVERYSEVDDLPLVSVALAGIAIRAGQVRLAAGMLDRLGAYAEASYIRATTLSAHALLSWRQGSRQQAHSVLEHALDAAVAEEVRRPFAGGGLEMRRLLVEHLARGSAHESFVTQCLAPRGVSAPLDTLSERERAVFAELLTTKTTQEIADALNVSINTVKTHQRSIYRKLGATTRREAIRHATSVADRSAE